MSVWKQELSKIVSVGCIMGWYLSTPESSNYVFSASESVIAIPISLFSGYLSLLSLYLRKLPLDSLCHTHMQWWWETDCTTTTPTEWIAKLPPSESLCAPVITLQYHMYIYREAQKMNAKLWCSKSYDGNKDNLINQRACGYGTLKTTAKKRW